MPDRLPYYSNNYQVNRTYQEFELVPRVRYHSNPSSFALTTNFQVVLESTFTPVGNRRTVGVVDANIYGNGTDNFSSRVITVVVDPSGADLTTLDPNSVIARGFSTPGELYGVVSQGWVVNEQARLRAGAKYRLRISCRNVTPGVASIEAGGVALTLWFI